MYKILNSHVTCLDFALVDYINSVPDLKIKMIYRNILELGTIL